MAVTKELTSAVPSVSGGKVVEWEVGMTYTNGVSGDAQYYVYYYFNTIQSDDDTYGFGLSAESDWSTRAQLLELCPVSTWDDAFEAQVQSMFNPPARPVPDPSYVIPLEG
tara:strand:- start:3370 stop:3699 length:330 start_codon:yes stop_codon:yes gene_type:complete